MKQGLKIGIIDVGGGLRDIYAAGVEDALMEQDIWFDYYLGISAGSANLASYISGQKKRGIHFYLDYSFRKKYISMRNFLFKRNYIDLDYAYGEISQKNGENPLDYEAIAANPAEFKVVTCDAETGETKYFDKSDLHQDNYDILKASSCLPVVNQPYEINGRFYYDGGMADPVPYKKAFEDGCDLVVLVLSRPRNFIRIPDRDIKFAKRMPKKYAKSAEEFKKRAEKYNTAVKQAKEYEKIGKLFVLAPDDCFGVETLTRDKERLQKLYDKGTRDAEKIVEFLKKAGVGSEKADCEGDENA